MGNYKIHCCNRFITVSALEAQRMGSACGKSNFSVQSLTATVSGFQNVLAKSKVDFPQSNFKVNLIGRVLIYSNYIMMLFGN